jgi:acetyl-CoA carboxylase carboxyltransferase component
MTTADPTHRVHEVLAQAARCEPPVVSFGPTGAVRSAGDASFPGLAGAPPTTQILRRRRRVPMATIIVSDTFGGSALLAVASDLVVQVRGTCLAATSPSVIELATGERIGAQALGGADVHALHTGQIDLVADSPEEAYAAVRRFLGVLPPDATTRARRVGGGAPLQPDDELEALAPSDRNRAYDVRELLGRVLDIGALFELAHGYGAGLLVALARLDGHAVGVVASQPLHGGGALDPPACEKAVRLLCLCDAFDLPILFFQDVPGFAAGPEAEHAGMLKHAARLQTALALAQAPKLTVVLGRGYGPAYFALGGNDTVDAVYAWPGAAISFTDPAVAATAVQAGEPQQRAAILHALEAQLDPYGGAAVMAADEIIDPARTRIVLGHALDRIAQRPVVRGALRPLATWPVR